MALTSKASAASASMSRENTNAEASSSKVKLDDLRQDRIEEAEERLSHTKLEHASELRDLFLLWEHNTRTGALGSLEKALEDDSSACPATLIPREVPTEASYRDKFESFYREHPLASQQGERDRASSIASVKLPSSAHLKRKLFAELGSSPPLKPGSQRAKAARAAEAQKTATKREAAPAAAASSSSTTVSRPANRRASTTKRAPGPEYDPTASVATPPPQPPPSAASAALVSKLGAGTVDRTVTSPAQSVTDDSRDTPVSEAPPMVPVPAPLVPSAMLASQPNPADVAAALLGDVDGTAPEQTPLHPTLQQLAPNPLSVTYASSLRPLPPDPFRRYTGTGVGGAGAGGSSSRVRKAPHVPSIKPGVPPPSGPTGSGQVDLWRWYVRSRASPGAGLVGKADKCLLTRDWRVAFTEQRFLRAMARIEKLKDAELWSFKQHKKAKAPVVRKAHWDFVLDEVKWMQTDFREERRWKIAVAYQLAHACRAWVKAKTPAARAGMCVLRSQSGKPSAGAREAAQRDEEMENAREREVVEVKEEPAEEGVEPMDVDREPPREAPPAESARKATPPADIEGEAEANVDADGDADADAEADADADADADGEADADGDADDGEVEAVTSLALKNEQEADASTAGPQTVFVHEPRAEAAMPQLSGPSRQQDRDESSMTPAMRTVPLRRDDTLSCTAAAAASVDEASSVPPVASSSRQEPQPEDLFHSISSTLRAPIFSMDISATNVSPAALLESFDIEAAAEMLGVDVDKMQSVLETDQTWSIAALFPELMEYGPPSVPEPGKGDKRIDEGSYQHNARLTQVTRLLDAKPLLVSTLEPGKNRAHGRWKEDSDWVIAAKLADPNMGICRQDLDLPPPVATTIFSRRSNKPSREAAPSAMNHVVQPREPELRAAQIFWSAEEDGFLMKLVQHYGTNWPLISDVFNSSRLMVPTDRREPWDCYDRWDRITKAAAEGKPTPPPPALPSLAPATPSIAGGAASSEPGATSTDTIATATSAAPPTMASSMAVKREKLAKKLTTKYDGSRRKMRHSNILEAMRKTAKRREATARPPTLPGEVRKVNLTSHETHNTPKGGATPTPQQLSLLKADKDEQHARQVYMYNQRRLEEQQRYAAQAAAMAQQQQHPHQQVNGAAPSHQQQQQQPGQQGQAVRPPGQQQQQGPQGQQQQQQPHSQQQQQVQRAMSMNAGRPPMPQINRPNSAAGNNGVQRPGTPQQQQQQQGQPGGLPTNPGSLTPQQQQSLGAAFARMTPQQQAAFASQMRGAQAAAAAAAAAGGQPDLQSYRIAVSQSMAANMAQAHAAGRPPHMPGGAGGGNTSSNTPSVTASPQMGGVGVGVGGPPSSSSPAMGNASVNAPSSSASAPTAGAGAGGGLSLGGLPAVTVAQIQHTLQQSLSQNLSQEQIQGLAMTLFRNAHEQHQAQLAQQRGAGGQGQGQGQGGAGSSSPAMGAAQGQMAVRGGGGGGQQQGGGAGTNSPRPPPPLPPPNAGNNSGGAKGNGAGGSGGAGGQQQQQQQKKGGK